MVAVIEKGPSTGDVLKGVSIEELADAAGAPQLAATFEAYQQAAAAGADGRSARRPTCWRRTATARST